MKSHGLLTNVAISVKIRGIERTESVDIAVKYGAKYIGFVFFPPSPRNLTIECAKNLIYRVPKHIKKVGLFVDPINSEIENVLSMADLDLIQLHGSESPARASEIKQHAGLPILKAIRVAEQGDLELAKDYYDVVDYLLFDSKVPADLPNALPGGNATSFDWKLLRHAEIPLPWMLAGGLIAENIKDAVQSSGANTIDVSSGVEIEPGIKDISLIKHFLDTAKTIKNDSTNPTN